MASVQSPNLDQFCSNVCWRLEAQKNPDFSSKYNLGKALLDISAVGTLYNFGSDLAISHRNDRSKQWFWQSIPSLQQEISKQPKDVELLSKQLINETRKLIEDEQATLQNSALARVVYLAALATAAAGSLSDSSRLQIAGGIGAVGMGAFFMSRAGFNSIDTYAEEKAKELQSIAVQIKSAVRA